MMLSLRSKSSFRTLYYGSCCSIMDRNMIGGGGISRMLCIQQQQKQQQQQQQFMKNKLVFFFETTTTTTRCYSYYSCTENLVYSSIQYGTKYQNNFNVIRIVERKNSSSSTNRNDESITSRSSSSSTQSVPSRRGRGGGSMKKPSTIVVAISSGVDSAVAAALLVQQYGGGSSTCSDSSSSSSSSSLTTPTTTIHAVHMSNWSQSSKDDDNTSIHKDRVVNTTRTTSTSTGSKTKRTTTTPTSCEYSELDWKDTKMIANYLQLQSCKRYYYEKEYWCRVFDPYIDNRYCGIITNPDIDCNKYIKFGVLLKQIQVEYGTTTNTNNTKEEDNVNTTKTTTNPSLSSITTTTTTSREPFLFATGHYARLWHRDFYDDDNEHENHHDNDTTSSTTTISHHGYYVPEIVQKALQKHYDDGIIKDIFSTSSSSTSNNNMDWLLSWGCQMYPDRPPPILLSARDKAKDQSYFLAGCTGDAFQNVIFPLGDYYKNKVITNNEESFTKRETNNENHDNDDNDNQQQQLSVRELAIKFGLPNAHRRDSMGICFVGKRKSGFTNFLQSYLPPATSTPLSFIDIETMDVVGTRKDLRNGWNRDIKNSSPSALLYTIGQGAKISNCKTKYFVVDILPSTNTVMVCPGTYHPALFCDMLTIKIKDMNWMARNECPLPLLLSSSSSSSKNNIGTTSSSSVKHGGSLRAQCRVQHLQPLVDCTIRFGNSNDNINDTLHVYFDSPMRGITSGQMIVFYILDGLICLGGGPIHQRGKTYWEQKKYLNLNKIHRDR